LLQHTKKHTASCDATCCCLTHNQMSPCEPGVAHVKPSQLVSWASSLKEIGAHSSLPASTGCGEENNPKT
jgi:hypothetical protein